MDAALQNFQAQIEQATAQKTALHIRGGGTKDGYGNPRVGEVLDTRAYCGVVDYDPAELVITARCGTPLAEIEALLASQGQMLAFEPPRYAARGTATFGGMVASGLAGPRRYAVGGVRDFVLGAKLLTGAGEVLSFGGTVMKNVAGYDVSRLLAGSRGTLGVVLEVSLKVLPQPFAEATLTFEADEATANLWVNQWGGQPLPISATAWHDGMLTVRLSGARAAVSAAHAKLGGALLAEDAAHAFLESLREQTHAFFSTPLEATASLWRVAVPSTTAALALQGEQLVEWGGGQRWWRTSQTEAAVRAAAQAVDGHATWYAGGAGAARPAAVFPPLAAPLQAIETRLRHVFDPAGIFA